MKYPVLVIILFFCCSSLFSFAQKKVLLLAGTIVPVTSETEMIASDLTEGQTIHLSTIRDVVAETGDVVIPKGSLVMARVVTALRSKLAGTKGRLTIDIKEVYLPSGIKVPLCDGTIYFVGKNRTGVVSVGAALFAPIIFISGTKAVLPANYEMYPKVEVSQYIVISE